MDSLVSVIVPVYKVEDYLDKCVETLVHQTYPNIEIILVDDGSPDSCPQKCDNWAQKDSRIQVIHKKNEGPGFARNDGLEVARGEFITFVDSDDYLASDAIAVMLDRIKRDQSDIVISQCLKVYPDGAQNTPAYPVIRDRVLTKDEMVQMMGLSQTWPIYAWGKLYRSHIFDKIRYMSLSCAEDVYILPEILEKCKKISFVEQILYFYYQRSSSIVHNKKTVQIMDSICASIHISKYLLAHGNVEGASRYYYSAVSESYALKNAKEVRNQVQAGFGVAEKRLLRKAIDRNMMMSILAAQFPSVYKFYRSHMKR